MAGCFSCFRWQQTAGEKPAGKAASSEGDIVFKPGRIGIHYEFDSGKVLEVHVGGEAASQGVQAGWYLSSVEDRPYTNELFLNCRNGSKPYRVAFKQGDITFEPGRIGIHYELDSGKVLGVEAGGQASGHGVKTGWCLSTVDGRPYTNELFLSCTTGGKPYRVDFKKECESKASGPALESASPLSTLGPNDLRSQSVLSQGGVQDSDDDMPPLQSGGDDMPPLQSGGDDMPPLQSGGEIAAASCGSHAQAEYPVCQLNENGGTADQDSDEELPKLESACSDDFFRIPKGCSDDMLPFLSGGERTPAEALFKPFGNGLLGQASAKKATDPLMESKSTDPLTKDTFYFGIDSSRSVMDGGRKMSWARAEWRADEPTPSSGMWESPGQKKVNFQSSSAQDQGTTASPFVFGVTHSASEPKSTAASPFVFGVTHSASEPKSAAASPFVFGVTQRQESRDAMPPIVSFS